MAAMNKITGKLIEGAAEVQQAVEEIIGTIPGDRVMSHDYGSELFELTDVALNGSGKARVNRATVEAIRKWEPRITITRAEFTAAADGTVVQTISGTVKTTREQITVRR